MVELSCGWLKDEQTYFYKGRKADAQIFLTAVSKGIICSIFEKKSLNHAVSVCST
jgi:hypothetical protein